MIDLSVCKTFHLVKTEENMPNLKREYYEMLIDKLDRATENEYYLESMVLSYCIIEDRINSIIKLYSLKTKPKQMLGDKIVLLRKEIIDNNDKIWDQVFPDRFLDNIVVWKDDRNQLTHKLANSVMSQKRLDNFCLKIASEGSQLTRELCKRVMKMKRIMTN